MSNGTTTLEPGITEQDLQRVIHFVHSWNACQPDLWVDINQVAISAELATVSQAQIAAKVLERRGCVRTKEEGTNLKIQLAPAGFEEVIRSKTPLPHPDIIDQAKAAARRKPWVAWPILVMLALMTFLAFFNQVVQALKNIGVWK